MIKTAEYVLGSQIISIDPTIVRVIWGVLAFCYSRNCSLYYFMDTQPVSNQNIRKLKKRRK